MMPEKRLVSDGSNLDVACPARQLTVNDKGGNSENI